MTVRTNHHYSILVEGAWHATSHSNPKAAAEDYARRRGWRDGTWQYRNVPPQSVDVACHPVARRRFREYRPFGRKRANLVEIQAAPGGYIVPPG